jgi:tetratricopeptide (TPR) repeat protein
MRQRLRVFVSSPGDVKKERLRASLVIDKLAQDYGRFFAIEGYLWEHEPMLSAAHFQDAIEPPNAFDIVILILWSRLGTLLPEKTALREYRGIDDRAPVTGTEWEYEDALRSARAIGLPDLMVFRNISSAPVDTQNPEAREASIAQLSALDTFWKLHFADQGAFRYAFDNYDTLEHFAGRLEAALRKVIERRIRALAGDEQRANPIWLGEPFRGLESYEFEHAPIFFGRDAQVTKAVELLAANAAAGTAFLLVSGASGSGKSSLVKAAMVPRLMKPQRITGAAFLRRAVFRAGAGGGDPFLGLAQALSRETAQDDVGLPEVIGPDQDARALASYLRSAAKDPGFAFGNALGRLTQAERDGGRLLSYEAAKLILVVDQLEELFTVPGIVDEDRRCFIELLGGLARSGHVWVIATLRADFWHRAAEIPELIALAQGQGRLDLATPSLAEQAEIIRKPAMAAGLVFEAHPQTGLGLDVVLTENAAAAPGVLPLLSFTLDELYRDAKVRGAHILSHSCYAALGGLEGAIAKRADEVVDDLPAAAAAELPRVLRALATMSTTDENVPVSRSAPLSRFVEGGPARQLADALIAARLLVADQSGATPTVRLVHEALIGRWRRASNQLAADRRDLEIRAMVEDQFRRWRHEQGAQRLLRNPDLANAVDLASRWGEELDAPIRDYIKLSGQRARLAQTLTAAAALVFFLVGAAAVVEGFRAHAKEQEAEANYRLALDQAAGSADTLNRGFIDGAVNSRLMSELVKRGQDTVSKLPATSDDVTAARAKLLIAMSPAMTAVGEMGKAREYAGAATGIVDDLLRRDPERFEWRRLWAESRAALGVVLFWSGDDPSAAREQSQAAIAEFSRLQKIAPNDPLIDEKLMSCYENLGDSSRTMGDIAGATAAFHEWLDLANKLADRTADRMQADFWRSYAADAHLRLGDMLQAQKKYDAGAAEDRAGLAIASRLHDDEPGNAKFLEHLSLGYGKLGDALIAGNDPDQAIKDIDLNINLSNVLVNDLSANIRWMLYQEWSHLRKGRALMALKRYEEAYAEFTIYLHGVERMLERDPGYFSALYDAANAHQYLGDALRLQDKKDDASAEYHRSLQGALEAVQKNPPNNQAARKILAMAYYRLGLMAELQRRTEEAANDYRQCAAIQFNRNSWTPRSPWPEDVTQTCKESLAQLSGDQRP